MLTGISSFLFQETAQNTLILGLVPKQASLEIDLVGMADDNDFAVECFPIQDSITRYRRGFGLRPALGQAKTNF